MIYKLNLKYSVRILVYYMLLCLLIYWCYKFEKSSIVFNQTIIAPKYSENYHKPLKFDFFTYDFWKDNDLLQRGLTISEHKKFMNLIEISALMFGMNKMEYYIAYGSVIGIN